MTDYLPIVVMLVLAVAFAVVSLIVSRLLAPYRPSSAKSAPYESGIVPSREPPERFSVRFYLVAMIFIVFDIEVIFLYPWAVIHRELGAYGLWVMVAFIVPFFLSFVWEIAEGGLDWGPNKVVQRAGGAVDEHRTTSTTVRRVGLEGREAHEEVLA
jgi:NADH-quinone oxidoreductase subunit A